MKRARVSIMFVVVSCAVIGCGYTTKSALPGHFRTVHVQPFKNRINYTTESRRTIYFPLLEVEITDAIIDRFLFDGNLRIADADAADLILGGDLVGYDRGALRYTDNDDVQEYRVQVIVNMTVRDTREDVLLWRQNGFVGEATYFVTGAQAISEETAVENATNDLARRIVERIIEDW